MSKIKDITAELFDYDLFIKAFGGKTCVNFKKRDVPRMLNEWLGSGSSNIGSFLYYRDYVSSMEMSDMENESVLRQMGVDEAKFTLWKSLYDEEGNQLPDTIEIPVCNMETSHIEKAVALMERSEAILNPRGRQTLATLSGELTKRKENEKTNITVLVADPVYNGEPNVQIIQPRRGPRSTELRASIQ